nr:BTAD domain-containing putative transcriptional regulator [uncultured Dethiosulfovibrio sp.]
MYARLFGPPSLSVRGDPVIFPFKKVEALSYILITEGGASRTWLAQHLWPEKEEKSGAKNLRNALYQLRSIMPQSTILSNNSRISIAPGKVRSDLDFLSDLGSLGERDLKRLGLPYLEGFSLEGTEEFNHWAQGKRDYFRGLYVKNLRHQAEKARLSGEDDRSVMLLTNALSIAPWDEEIVQKLMESLGRQGNLSRIVETYAALSTRLRNEMGIDPSPETTDLYKLIFQKLDSVSVQTRGDFSKDLWGRDGEKAQILNLIASQDDKPLCISLWGAEGSGRTAILNRILRDHSDMVGKSIVCSISHQNRGNPWHDLYQIAARYGLFLDEKAPFREQGREIADFIGKRSQEGKITFFLDEMRFIGREEIELMKIVLSSEPENLTVLMVDHSETFYDNDRWLGAMASEGKIRYRSIKTLPFGPRECGMFCRHILGITEDIPLPDEEERIYKETLGLPVCLSALSELYAQGRGLEDLGDRLEFPIRAMSNRLSPIHIEIMETLSIIDEPVSLDILKDHMVNKDLEPELIKLEKMDLLKAEISIDGNAAMAVIHPQIKAFFRRSAPKLKRHFVSQRMLAKSLEREPMGFYPPNLCLRDIDRSKEGGSLEQRIEAHGRYLRLLVRAKCEGFPPIEDRIIKKLEQSRANWSREIDRLTVQIQALFQRAVGDNGTIRSLQNRFQATTGFHRLWAGDLDRGKRHLVGALEESERRGDRSLSIECLHGLCLLAIRTGDDDLLSRYGEEMEIASGGDRLNRSIALRMRGVAIARGGSLEEGRQQLTLSLDILEDLKNLGRRYSSLSSMVESSLGKIALDNDDLPSAEIHLKKALMALKRGEIHQGRWIIHIMTAQLMWLKGDYEGLSEHLAKARDYKDEIIFGDLGIVFNSLCAYDYHVKGDLQGAARHLKRAHFSATWLVKTDNSMDFLEKLESYIANKVK